MDYFYSDRPVHDQATARLYEWYDNFMQKNAQPEIAKVGPHGYDHGWVYVGGDDDHGGASKVSGADIKPGMKLLGQDGDGNETQHTVASVSHRKSRAPGYGGEKYASVKFTDGTADTHQVSHSSHVYAA